MKIKTEQEVLFEEGLAAYEAGHYYDAHEKWEEIWNEEEDDDHRLFLQALIQITSALHKVTHGVEPRGALRLLDRALEKTENLPPSHGGIALQAMRQGVMRFRKEVERALSDDIKSVDLSLVPPIVRQGDGIAWRPRPEAPVPDATKTFRAGVSAYEKGAFYEAHEHWEELWRIEPEGPRKRFLQGLIQTAAAMHKLTAMKSASGAIRLFEKAKSHLTGIPEGMGGVAVKGLVAGIDGALAALPTLVTENRTDLDKALVPVIGPAPN
ncbi:MAG: DUF309 domain-containing protein [Polyangiaceae bacterium]|nr:DUF309 domain-containing protein [Polyangiaceae bacterium]